MSFTVIIPARLKSSRLPDKPLADIGGKPMIVRVAERAAQCGADRVVIAVDDESVAVPCRAAGFDVVMTSPNCPTGTDRLAEAVEKIGLNDDDIIVNLQGDDSDAARCHSKRGRSSGIPSGLRYGHGSSYNS